MTRYSLLALRTASVLSLIVLLMFGIACKDDGEPTLPKITIVGAGTFGCRIDGAIYVPKGSHSGARVQTSTTMINVLASGDMGNFSIEVRDSVNIFFEDTPYYFTTEEKGTNCRYNDGATCRYDVSPVSGYIKFSKIDFTRNVIAGVFEFTAFSPECNKIIHITEGRFDLRTDL